MNVKEQVLLSSLMNKKLLINVLLVVPNVLTELFVRVVTPQLYSMLTFVLLNVLTL
jgi:hypothetical protein